MKALPGRSFWLWLSLFSLAGLMVSCATVGAGKAGSEARLRERVEAYWGAKVAGQLDQAYGFEEPLFRKAVSPTNYIRRRGAAGKWEKATVESVELDGNEATVKLTVGIRVAFPGASKKVLPVEQSERWVFIDSDWYHAPEERR